MVPGLHWLLQGDPVLHHLLVHENRHVFAHVALIVIYIVCQSWGRQQGGVEHLAQGPGGHSLRRAIHMAAQTGCKFDNGHGVGFQVHSIPISDSGPPWRGAAAGTQYALSPELPYPLRAVQQPTVIILASGRGERFIASGGTGHKLQARLGELTVLQHTIAAARASGLPWHVEDAGHPGMGDSISAAVQATAEASGWLILPGDLPLVQPATLRLVAIALAFHEVVLPRYQGERGHPVGFGASCGPALMALRGDQGAAGLLRERAVHVLVLGDAGCVTDIDTVDDLERARLLLLAEALHPR